MRYTEHGVFPPVLTGKSCLHRVFPPVFIEKPPQHRISIPPLCLTAITGGEQHCCSGWSLTVHCSEPGGVALLAATADWSSSVFQQGEWRGLFGRRAAKTRSVLPGKKHGASPAFSHAEICAKPRPAQPCSAPAPSASPFFSQQGRNAEPELRDFCCSSSLLQDERFSFQFQHISTFFFFLMRHWMKGVLYPFFVWRVLRVGASLKLSDGMHESSDSAVFFTLSNSYLSASN